MINNYLVLSFMSIKNINPLCSAFRMYARALLQCSVELFSMNTGGFRCVRRQKPKREVTARDHPCRPSHFGRRELIIHAVFTFGRRAYRAGRTCSGILRGYGFETTLETRGGRS